MLKKVVIFTFKISSQHGNYSVEKGKEKRWGKCVWSLTIQFQAWTVCHVWSVLGIFIFKNYLFTYLRTSSGSFRSMGYHWPLLMYAEVKEQTNNFHIDINCIILSSERTTLSETTVKYYQVTFDNSAFVLQVKYTCVLLVSPIIQK